MFSNRKNNGMVGAASSRSDSKARNNKTSKNSQQYKSVLNSSVHGVFSIEDEEEDDDEGKLDAVWSLKTLRALVPIRQNLPSSSCLALNLFSG